MVCGAALVVRSQAQVEEDLARVRWLLGELDGWDELAPVSVRVNSLPPSTGSALTSPSSSSRASAG